MKFHVIAIVFNFLIKTAKAEVKYFNLRTVDDFDNTLQRDGLEKPVTVVAHVSNIECAINCVNSESCVSVDYNVESKTCRLNEYGLNTAIDPSPILNGTRRYMFFEGLIGHYCDPWAGCVVENSECRTEGVCGCKAGYGFQQSSHTCEKDCVLYGDTFQYYYQRHIVGNNINIFPGTPAAQCAKLCIEATSYSCISFDTDPATDNCLLQDVDASTGSIPYESGPQWNHYQRNCA